MGASVSVIPFGYCSKSKDETLKTTTPRKKKSSFSHSNSMNISDESMTPKRKKSFNRKAKTPQVVRRSRRIPKCDPPKVVFPSVPRAKTPSRKKYPLTPTSRRRAEADSKPILRKSPRIAKFKFLKVAKVLPKQSPNATYKAGEPVFAWYKGILYEARIMNIEEHGINPAQSTYYVHYIGYKKYHDNWITPNEIMKVGPSSRRYFREVRGKVAEI
ncbi:hypothetical protein ACHAWF_009096 [Thalassiosira exigua]